MFIVICNSTQRAEGSYVNCNELQYTESGGSLCS
jgi:hypothetical protein